MKNTTEKFFEVQNTLLYGGTMSNVWRFTVRNLYFLLYGLIFALATALTGNPYLISFIVASLAARLFGEIVFRVSFRLRFKVWPPNFTDDGLGDRIKLGAVVEVLKPYARGLRNAYDNQSGNFATIKQEMKEEKLNHVLRLADVKHYRKEVGRKEKAYWQRFDLAARFVDNLPQSHNDVINYRSS